MTETEKQIKSNAILAELRKGQGRTTACKIVGIAYNTIRKWMDEDKEYLKQIIDAESEGDEKIKDACVLRIIEASRKDWRAASWILERRHHKQYGRRDAHEFTGQDGGPVVVIDGKFVPGTPGTPEEVPSEESHDPEE